MRIISKFKDYYDGCRAWRDDTLTYVRHSEEFERTKFNNEMKAAVKPLLDILDEDMPQARHRHQLVNTAVIGFCGKAYPVLYLSEHRDGPVDMRAKSCYDTHSLEKELDKRVSYEVNKRGYIPSRAADYISDIHLLDIPVRKWGRSNLCHISWNKFSNEFNPDIGDDVFLALRAPVILATDRSVVTNPCLKDLNFATQADPFTAYQELSMYLGNNMVDQMDPNIERTDDLIRDQKGFDKWSFRTIGRKGK